MQRPSLSSLARSMATPPLGNQPFCTAPRSGTLLPDLAPPACNHRRHHADSPAVGPRDGASGRRRRAHRGIGRRHGTHYACADRVRGQVHRHLTVIERHPIFHQLLTDRFPSLRVLCGDAQELGNILAPAEMGQVGVVVSSLPRVGWPLARQRSILEQCFTALRGGGAFLEFSYGPLSPVPSRLVRELGLVPRRVQRVWGNFPPATIWAYRRAGPSQACVFGEHPAAATIPGSDLRTDRPIPGR